MYFIVNNLSNSFSFAESEQSCAINFTHSLTSHGICASFNQIPFKQLYVEDNQFLTAFERVFHSTW